MRALLRIIVGVRAARRAMRYSLACIIIAAAPALAETRLGLVIGNAAYPDNASNTALNDAALIREALRSVGFEVVEGRDLDRDGMRRLVRSYLEKIKAVDDDVVAFVYYAGRALQSGGDNYLVPLGARLERPIDASTQTYGLDALLTDLAASKSRISFVAIDASTELPFVAEAKLAPGFAISEPLPGSLIALSTSPGETTPQATGEYGAFAQALMQMLREPGLAPADLFNRVRLRVHEATKGVATPFISSKANSDFRFLERVNPLSAASPPDRRPSPPSRASAASAYVHAIERGTLGAYQDFLDAHASDPLAKRIRAMLARTREALAWRRATVQRTREAFWTYRRWYPLGPHVEEAGYALIDLSAPLTLPPEFVGAVWNDIPPPPADEQGYFETPPPPALAYADAPIPPMTGDCVRRNGRSSAAASPGAAPDCFPSLRLLRFLRLQPCRAMFALQRRDRSLRLQRSRRLPRSLRR